MSTRSQHLFTFASGPRGRLDTADTCIGGARRARPRSRGGIIHRALIAVLLLTSSPLDAQQGHVRWSVSPVTAPVTPGSTIALTVKATIDEGWHVYSLTQGPGGPIPLRITLRDTVAVIATGPVRGPAPERVAQSSFGIPVELYSDSASFSVPVRVRGDAGPPVAATVIIVRFQVCSAEICMPPRTVELPVSLTISRAGSVGTAHRPL